MAITGRHTISVGRVLAPLLVGAAMWTLGASSALAATSATPYDFFRLPNPDAGPEGRFGDRMRAAGDLDGDGAGDLWLGQYGFDDGGLENVGRVYAISGKDRSVLYQIDSPEPQNLSEGRGGFGWALSNVGDIDGDGRDDLLVGSPRHRVYTGTGPQCGEPEPNGCNEDQGRAWLYSGAPEKPKTPLRTLDNPVPQGTADNIAAFGYRLGKAGDLNGDGRSELLIGAPNNDGAAAGSEAETRPGGAAGCADTEPFPAGCRRDQGQAFVFDGATGAVIRTLDVPAADRYLEPSGVCTTDPPGPSFTICGELGLSAQGPGDVTGDSVPDQLVGAWSYSPGSGCGEPEPNQCVESAGAYYLFDGETGAFVRRIDNPAPTPGGRFGLQEVAEESPGDLNGDGRVELYAAAPQQVGPSRDGGSPLPGEGRAWVFNGADGSILFSLRDPSPGASGNFGYSMARTDYDRDGHPDLYVGSHEGTYVFNGRDASLFKSFDLPASEFADQPSGNTNLGRSTAAPGDLNGDCEPDYVAGSPGHDAPGANGEDEGRLYFHLSAGPSACPTTSPPPDGVPPDRGGDDGGGPGGRVKAVFTTKTLAARQRGKRVVVRVSVRLLETQGRPCQGRIAVGVELGGRKGRRLLRLRGRCTQTMTFRFRVAKLKKKVRSRERRLLVRTRASYKGSKQLEGDRAPSVLRRVIR